MAFDFFNTSHLAFGSKLTKAFLQLDRLCTEAEENQESLNTIIEQYSQYVNRNYKAPFPTRPDAPCRTNEIFDIINDLNSIKYLRINEEGNLECAINLFKRVSNRFTVATGTTELKKGYASVLDSISNARPEREIQFTETYPSSGNFLFEFRIDEYNNINIVGDSRSYFIPGDFNHIVGMEYEKDVSTSSYTAEGNECIVCVGLGGRGNKIRRLTVKVDNVTKIDVGTKNGKNFGVVYLKPGETLTGTMSRAFKVKYLAKEVAIPQESLYSFITNGNTTSFKIKKGATIPVIDEETGTEVDYKIPEDIVIGNVLQDESGESFSYYAETETRLGYAPVGVHAGTSGGFCTNAGLYTTTNTGASITNGFPMSGIINTYTNTVSNTVTINDLTPGRIYEYRTQISFNPAAAPFYYNRGVSRVYDPYITIDYSANGANVDSYTDKITFSNSSSYYLTVRFTAISSTASLTSTVKSFNSEGELIDLTTTSNVIAGRFDSSEKLPTIGELLYISISGFKSGDNVLLDISSTTTSSSGTVATFKYDENGNVYDKAIL